MGDGRSVDKVKTITYRALDPSDAPEICSVHRAAFAHMNLERTIFCSRRVEQYISDIMLESTTSSKKLHEFVGASVGQELIGYAHFRRLTDSWHLNQIAVRPDYHARGIGRRFIELWHQRALDEGYESLSLDVEASNLRAVQWYHRLGMRVVSTSTIYEYPVTSRQNTARIKPKGELVNWENSIISRRRHGFTTLQVSFGGRVFRVGWLCNSLRIDEDTPEEVLDEALGLLPEVERVFLVSSRRSQMVIVHNRSWQRASTIFRMQSRTCDFLKE